MVDSCEIKTWTIPPGQYWFRHGALQTAESTWANLRDLQTKKNMFDHTLHEVFVFKLLRMLKIRFSGTLNVVV